MFSSKHRRGCCYIRNRHDIPLVGPFSIPVAVTGALLSSVGLLDVFISDEVSIETLIFPNETVSRPQAFDVANDLATIRQEIKDIFKYTREGKNGDWAHPYTISQLSLIMPS